MQYLFNYKCVATNYFCLRFLGMLSSCQCLGRVRAVRNKGRVYSIAAATDKIYAHTSAVNEEITT